MSDTGKAHTTLAAFTVDSGDAARRLLKAVQRVDDGNDNVQIVDAAVVDRGRFGRVSVHQTTDRGALKTGVRVGTLGVVVDATDESDIRLAIATTIGTTATAYGHQRRGGHREVRA